MPSLAEQLAELREAVTAARNTIRPLRRLSRDADQLVADITDRLDALDVHVRAEALAQPKEAQRNGSSSNTNPAALTQRF